jgi:LemA protein
MDVLAIIVGLVLVLAVVFMYVYNHLVSRRLRGQEAWGQVKAQLKRRYDLTPNLAETIRARAGHEADIIDGALKARENALMVERFADKADAEDDLTFALRELIRAAQRYPSLKASPEYVAMRDELDDINSRIDFANEQYNQCVDEYNEELEKLAHKIVARMLGLRRQAHFRMDPVDAPR